MEFAPDVIIAASKLKRGAIVSILEEAYPRIYRLAMALSGREDVARGIVRFVAARSLRVMPKWTEDTDPRAWFWRYTILTSRRAARHRSDPRKDALLTDANDPGQFAFIAALRKLPHQQQEAFIFDACEKAPQRHAAAAMDCSTLAMENHLKAANDSLRLVADKRYEELVALLAAQYASLAPDEALTVPRIQAMISRFIWPRRIMRIAKLLLVIAIIWGAWKLWSVLEL